MDWQPYIFAGTIALMVMVVGIVWILVWHWLKAAREEKILYALQKDVLHRVKKATVEVMAECMDILPEKLMDAKKIIESE